MAIAGDVIIKLAADFAEFASGMATSQKTLEDFGKSIDQSASHIDKMASQLKGLAIASAAAYAVKEVADWVIKTADAAKVTEDLAKQTGLTIDEVQALQKAAKDTGQTFDQQLAYYKNHRAELKALTDQMRDTGQLMKTETVSAFADVSRAMTTFGTSLALVRQSFQGGTIDNSLSLIAKMIRDAAASLAYFEVYKGTIQSVRELMAIFTGAGGLVGVSAAERAAQQIDLLRGASVDATVEMQKAEAQVKKLQSAQQDATAGGDAIRRQSQAIQQGQGAGAAAELDNAQKNLARATATNEAAKKQLDAAEAAFKKGQEVEKKANEPPPAPKPVPVPTGGGGGGGRTDDESVQAQINRYTALGTAATAAYNKIFEKRQENIEDLTREVKVQQEVDAIAGKLGAKYADASDVLKTQLRDRIRAYEQEKDAVAKRLEIEQSAADTERKMGDGTAAYAKIQLDLSRQLTTTRLTQDAYNRALKQGKEDSDNAADAAARYDDNLGSLTSGFARAAREYARSNDLYALGQQTFTGLTTAMGDSLDVLTGKSSKTFASIASDFASMLAKMALQAALSPVFKYIGNALGAGGMASAGLPGSPFFGPPLPGMASGGPVVAGQAYTVGEAGPERFVPAVNGSIMPASATNQSGGITVNVAMGTAQGAADPGQALEFGRRVKAAVVDVIAQEKRPGGTLYARHNA